MVGPGGEEKVGDLEGSGEGVGKRVEGCAGAGGGGEREELRWHRNVKKRLMTRRREREMERACILELAGVCLKRNGTHRNLQAPGFICR